MSAVCFLLFFCFVLLSSGAEGHLERDLRIVSKCVPAQPWTVAGERGALLGRQDGVFEAWQWPVKLFSGVHINAELADYAVPIDVNRLAAVIDVRPAETVITYSHAAFTIRQHMFAERGDTSHKIGAGMFFEIESLRALDLTFSFTPDMQRMWPAPEFGRPDVQWQEAGGRGFYILSTADPTLSAVIAMPGAKPGIMVPYQEHPQSYPAQFKLHFDPKTDSGHAVPLVFALRDERDPEKQVQDLIDSLPGLKTETERYYAHFFDHRLIPETPDTRLNDAVRWAEIAIDQSRVVYSGGGTGMVAGYYESGDSARPGFAWYFGRDTLWTTYAINSYGDFALTRRALDFLFSRQRADGKIMHEFSQSAAFVDWLKTPYFYASADSTCLLVMAMRDYVAASGDVAYVQAHWDAVKKAYAFTRAHDSDRDGIYDNSEGTGWVESWPDGMPHQEIYLAALDQQSSQAMSKLAVWMRDDSLGREAATNARDIAEKIANEYEQGDGWYAFSHNPSGADKTRSIYPALAWWDGDYKLEHPEAMFSDWASAEFSTDWGTRDISEHTPFYDAISYHQGSVWPLFTGWVSVAEYRSGHSLSGYAHLMQNANLTWSQDLGAVTELLSGQYFQPLGRSTSHQMWSSAMVLSPLLRGMFGLSWDAPVHTLRVAPSLPADWDHATLRHVSVGDAILDLEFRRENGNWSVTAKSESGKSFCLQSSSHVGVQCVQAVQVPVPPVEIAIPAELPEPGSETAQLKVLSQSYDAHEAAFKFAAPGGSKYDLFARVNQAHASVQGASLRGDRLALTFPEGKGYQEATVRFRW